MKTFKQIKQKLEHFFYTMQRKLLLSYLALFLVFFCMLQIFYEVSYQTILSDAKINAMTQLKQMDLVFENTLNTVDNISMSIVSNRTIKEMLGEKDDIVLGSNRRFIDNILQSIFISNSFLLDLVVMDGNEQLYGIQSFSRLDFMDRFRPYFGYARQIKGKNIWPGLQRDSSGEYVFPSIASLTDYYTGESMGVLVMNIKADFLWNLLLSSASDNRTAFYLLNENGTYLMDSNLDFSEMNTKPHAFVAFSKIAVMDSMDGALIIRDQGVDYLVSFVRNSRSGWYLVEKTSISNLTQSAKNVKDTFLFIGIGVAFLGVISSLFFAKRMTADINDIRRGIGEIQNGNFDIVIHSRRKDEIGSIAHAIDDMTAKIKELIHKNYEQRILMSEARLAALQAQISPHFIYNALDAINWQLLAAGETDISGTVVALGDLLRYSISHSNDFVPLSSELEYVSNYLLIHGKSFNSRIQYTIDVQIPIEDVLVPRLIIQPVLENAVVHGVGKLLEKGEIAIRVCRDGDYVVIAVENNGPNADLDRINRLIRNGPENQPQGKHNGIGVHNVNQRIQTIYGEDCGISFHQREPQGVIVQLRITAHRNEEKA